MRAESEDAVCTRNEATYESLPVMDGNIYSGNGIIAGTYIVNTDGTPFPAEDFRFEQTGPDCAVVDFGSIRFTLTEQGIRIAADKEFTLENRVGKAETHFPAISACTDTLMQLEYDNIRYAIGLDQGRFEGPGRIQSESNGITLHIL